MSTLFMDDPLESVTITSTGLTNENLYKLMSMKHLTNLHLGNSLKLLNTHKMVDITHNIFKWST